MFGGKASDEINRIPLSNDTVQRRIKFMAESVEDQLVTCLRQSQFFSLQLDESTNIGNEANLLCFVRYIYAGGVHDDFHDDFSLAVPCQPTPQEKQFFTPSMTSS